MTDYVLVAFQVDNRGTAIEFAAAASRPQTHERLLIHDAVHGTSELDGTTSVTETNDVAAGRSAMTGAGPKTTQRSGLPANFQVGGRFVPAAVGKIWPRPSEGA